MTQRARWEWIADALRADILDGRHPPGGLMPSEAELAQAHRCSRPTVRRAFAELVAEGLLTVAHGRGTFVRARPDRRLIILGSDRCPDLLATAPTGWLPFDPRPEPDEADLIDPDDEDAAARRTSGPSAPELPGVDYPSAAELEPLELRPGTPLFTRMTYWRHYKTGRVLRATSVMPRSAITTDTDPETLADAVADLDHHPGNPYRQLDAQPGAHWTLTVHAHMPVRQLAEDLSTDPGTPLLTIRRLIIDGQGHPLELTTINAPADHFETTTAHDHLPDTLAVLHL